MLKFKEFILEYLTPEQDKEWSQVKMEPEARKATDHFFGEGNDHVREDIKQYSHDKSEIHRKVEEHLGKELSHEEYKSGLTNDKYGRQVKLGKMIKDDKLKTEYSNDSSRVGGKIKQPYMTVVRGHHVAGQTNPEPDELHPTGHAWENESCKNINTGCNRHYLSREIKHGSVVVRGHDADGKEIYRATLQPHIHESGGSHMYALNSEYGIKHPSFTAHAHDVADRLSGEYKSGNFNIHPGVYNDLGTSTQIHPGASSEDLTKMLDDHEKNSGNWYNRIYKTVINSRNATTEHMDRLQKHNSPDVRELVASSPKATPEHIDKALSDPSNGVREAAASNPNLSQSHIEKILKNPNEYPSISTRAAINAKGNNIYLALDHHEPSVRYRTLYMNPNVTAEHLTHILKGDSTPGNKVRALEHSKTNSSHIDLAINSSDSSVRVIAAQHPKATDENITNALSHPNSVTAHAALANNNLKPHHLELALNHPSNSVRIAAAGHHKLDPSRLSSLLASPNDDISSSAALNVNINSSHKEQMLSHPNSDVRMKAFYNHERFNITSEDLHKGLSDPSSKVREQITNRQDLTPEHINKAIDDPDDIVRLNAMGHKNADSSNIDKIFNEKHLPMKLHALTMQDRKLSPHHIDKMIADPNLKDLAITSQSLTPKHITKLLPDVKPQHSYAFMAQNGSKFTAKHLHTILSNPNAEEFMKVHALSDRNTALTNSHYLEALHPDQPKNVRRKAFNSLVNEDRVKPEHVTEALKGDDLGLHYLAANYATQEHLGGLLDHSTHPIVRGSAVTSPHVTSDQLGKVLSEPYDAQHSDVYEAAAYHRNLQPQHIEQMLTRPYTSHLSVAMKHKTAVTPNVISTALNYGHNEIGRSAATHPNASSENLHQAILHPNSYIALGAARNRNVTKEHLMKGALHHPNADVRDTMKQFWDAKS